MATLYEYKCKNCGYSTWANPKGHDMVMMGELYNSKIDCLSSAPLVKIVQRFLLPFSRGQENDVRELRDIVLKLC